MSEMSIIFAAPCRKVPDWLFVGPTVGRRWKKDGGGGCVGGGRWKSEGRANILSRAGGS